MRRLLVVGILGGVNALLAVLPQTGWIILGLLCFVVLAMGVNIFHCAGRNTNTHEVPEGRETRTGADSPRRTAGGERGLRPCVAAGETA